MNPLNEIHLYALQYVFLPRINESLEEFKNQWNHHNLRTSQHLTPLALWHTGMLNMHEESSIIDWETYGVDTDSSMIETDTNNNVVVPTYETELSEQELQELQLIVNPISDDGNSGISHFVRAKELIEELIS